MGANQFDFLLLPSVSPAIFSLRLVLVLAIVGAPKHHLLYSSILVSSYDLSCYT